MKSEVHGDRLEFIGVLRGVACLFVVDVGLSFATRKYTLLLQRSMTDSLLVNSKIRSLTTLQPCQTTSSVCQQSDRTD
jgi:hypothetical protein